MIDGLKPYAEYKESGQEWLDRVPAHWDVRRTKLILREVDSRSTTGKEQLLRVSQYTGVTQRRAADGSDALNTRAASLIGYKRVSANDLVINIMLAWNGSMGVSRFDGITSPAYCVYRLNRGAEPWYFHQLFRLPLYKGRIKAASTGVVESRLRLYSDDLGRIEALLPPHSEQTAIVRFLDHANRKIDRFVYAKQKLISVLQEQKQGIVAHAVTRGLHPGVPARGSDVAGLEDLPIHWELRPFVRCCTEQADYRGATPEKVESGITLVTAKNIRTGWIDYEASKEYVRRQDYSKIMRRGMPKIGDVLLTMEAPLGHVALIDREDIALAQRVIRFRLDRHLLLPEFALAAMNSNYFQNQLLMRGTGSTALGMKASKLSQLVLALPPVEEQEAILTHLSQALEPLSNAIARTEREIQLMQEFRTRLVTDVVTGTLDVRGVTVRDGDPLEGHPQFDTADSEYVDDEDLALVGGDD